MKLVYLIFFLKGRDSKVLIEKKLEKVNLASSVLFVWFGIDFFSLVIYCNGIYNRNKF